MIYIKILFSIFNICTIINNIHTSAITCPAIKTWEGLSINTSNIALGTVVNVTCKAGMEWIGPAMTDIVTVCGPTGDWQPTVGACGGTLCTYISFFSYIPSVIL